MSAYISIAAPTEPMGIELARRRGASLRDARGTLIAVHQGNVWITQDGDTADIHLDAGQSFRIERDGLTLVTAVAPGPVARLTFTPPEPPPPLAARIAAALTRAFASLVSLPARRSAGST